MVHVLNMLHGGTRMEHIELLRNNGALLNAVEVDSIPDPMTAGDFCRRFIADDLKSLTSEIHTTQLNVWRQPDEFFNEAFIDVIVVTNGECKCRKGPKNILDPQFLTCVSGIQVQLLFEIDLKFSVTSPQIRRQRCIVIIDS